MKKMNSNIENLNMTLIAVKKMFDDAGIEFFLSRGTLLQIYRSGKFNVWDDDIDVASFADVSKTSVRKKILDSVEKNGFSYNKTDDALEFRLGLCKKDCMPVGVAFWRDVNATMTRESNTKIRYKREKIRKLREIEYLGVKYLMPKEPEYLLELWYGDWKQIARKAWCTVTAGGKYNIHPDQKIAYRDDKAEQYYIGCDDKGNFPVNNIRVFKKTGKRDTAEKMYDTGLTFGAFDLFHKGHLNLLESIKYRCKKLIVCVSDDEYVEKHKGKKPVMSYVDRKKMVESIKYVDVVNIQSLGFGKLQAINTYRPDALFVGNDWNRKTYTGEGLGVPVIYLPYTKGISTTILREELNK